MNGDRQCVDWNGTRSDYTSVKYGIRQGSILGPLLFLVIVADLPEHLGLNQDFNAMYADDLDVWQAGKSPDEVAAKLEVIATRFTAFAKGNGLALNAKKVTA
jgi:hypothetical protein